MKELPINANVVLVLVIRRKLKKNKYLIKYILFNVIESKILETMQRLIRQQK